MATGYNVRVGDADREAVAAQLREHYADGRLTLEELNERLDQTFAAKTKADLNTVMRDLPQAARPTADMPYGGTAWQGPAWQGPMATRPGQDHGNGWGNGQQPTRARRLRADHGAGVAVRHLRQPHPFRRYSAVAAGRWRSCCSSRPWRWSGG